MNKAYKGFQNFYNAYARASDSVQKISTIFCYVLLVSVTAIAGLAVFYRYVLNSPIQWSEEVARYILIWLTMIAASIAIKTRSHIRLTAVVSRLPRLVSLIIEMLIILIIIGILYVVAKYSLLMVVTKSVRTYSPSVAVSMAWPHTALPVGFSLIIFQSVFVLLENIKMIFEAES
jgi:TRAP-type C4-dicarboxylate transport system permease small subunit